MSVMTRVGLYLGSGDDPTENIEYVLHNWNEILPDAINVDLFGSASPPRDSDDCYNIVHTPDRRSRTPFGKIINAYRDTVDYVRKRDPDIVIQVWKFHTHAPGVALGARRTGTPAVTRITGDVYNEYKFESGLRQAGMYCLDNVFGLIPPGLSGRIIALGPFEADEVVSRGAKRSDVVILPPPEPQDERFTPPAKKEEYKKALDIPLEKPVVLFVGRLSRRKGMSFMIDVIEKVLSEQDMTFLLVGDGPYGEELTQRFNLSVITPGQVPHSRIDEYYKAADMFVHPSPFEGVPLVILEALSCGLPVVARPAGDIPFVVNDKYLTQSPQEMAEKILAKPEEPVWENREYFKREYQERVLQQLITDLVRSQVSNS